MSSRQPYRYDDPSSRVIASWYDPVARAASRIVGGPWGVHARPGRSRFITPIRVLFFLATLSLALAWVKERPCAYESWHDGMQYTHMCYSDTIPLWGIEGIADGAVPYFSMDPTLAPEDPNYSFGRVEYPVLSGFFMWTADKLAAPAEWFIDAVSSEGESVNNSAGYFVTTVLMLSLCLFIIVFFTAKTAGRRVWDAAMVAAAPIVIVHAFTNWDLFAMAFLAVAMWAWSRDRPVLCGLMIGLGTAAKLYPVLMLGALLVLAIRTNIWRGFILATVSAVGAWLAVNLPVMIGAWEGWRVFLDLNQTRPSDYATLWQVAERAISDAKQFDFENLIPVETMNLLVLLTMGAACVGIALLALAAPQRPRVAQLVFLIVAAFIITNKVWSAQYSIWLLPLAVLALPRWRLLIAWQLAEAGVWASAMLWFRQRDLHYENVAKQMGSDPPRLLSGADYEVVALFVLIRSALIIVMMALVVRDILRPQLDRIRQVGQDDPSGGVFDYAPDAPWLVRARASWGRKRVAPPV